eukprot:scaffold57779_cov30-Tisochrysis_lutea.AAC.1
MGEAPQALSPKLQIPSGRPVSQTKAQPPTVEYSPDAEILLGTSGRGCPVGSSTSGTRRMREMLR